MKRNILADDEDGRLYVKMESIMNPLVALVDSLPLTLFDGDDTPYLSFDVAIEWARKESKVDPEYGKVADQLERIRSEYHQAKKK